MSEPPHDQGPDMPQSPRSRRPLPAHDSGAGIAGGQNHVTRRRTYQEPPGVGDEPPDRPSPPPANIEGNQPAVSPGRRAIRIVLLLLIMAGMLFMVFLLLDDSDRRRGAVLDDDVPVFNPLPENRDGDQLARILMSGIREGGYPGVLEKREHYLSLEPRHPEVLRAVYLADAAREVEALYEKLLTMPPIKSETGVFLAVEERLERIVPRMAVLDRLVDYREDWGDDLTQLPSIKEVYQSTRDETLQAHTRVADWQRYLGTMQNSLNALAEEPPHYEDVVDWLSEIKSMLPNNSVNTLITSVDGLNRARMAVLQDDMSAANAALQTVLPRQPSMPPVYAEDKLAAVIIEQRQALAKQFASWLRLWEEDEAASSLYHDGDMKGAVRILDAVIASTVPDTSASRSLYDQMRQKREHWFRINDAYEAAVEEDRRADLRARMALWQSFALLLNPAEDKWQTARALEGAERIKSEVNTIFTDFIDQYGDRWEDYQPISSQQRQPDSPRDEFLPAAEVLRTLAVESDRMLATREEVKNLDLDDKANSALQMARRILAEQGGQAQSLWNLGRLYRDRGEIRRFRECLERILLLGDNPGNPFFVEARQILAEGDT